MPATPLNFAMRLDPQTEYALDRLAERFGLNRSALVRVAVRRWANAEGIEIPPELAGPQPYPRRREPHSR